jgi:hypothetical protein
LPVRPAVQRSLMTYVQLDPEEHRENESDQQRRIN